MNREASDTLPAIARLLEVMARLRDPETGCPWDVEQDFASIAPYTIEEAYEVADAIMRGCMDDLKDELGDLLFQVVFHARMAEEGGAFDFEAVARAVVAKMIRRHPHVFGDESVADAAAQTEAWEAQKAAERRAKASGNGEPSVLDGVPLGMPALMRAAKLQRRAARVGFDWSEPREVLAKLREEIDELEAVMAADGSQELRREEMGDLLFAVTNLARKVDLDAEAALTMANVKFERRFREVEMRLAARGKAAEDSTLDEMEELWRAVKAQEFR